MSSREFSEWIEFYRLEPFGTDIDLLGHAITASVTANANRPKGHKAYRPEEFMPNFEKREQTVDEQIQFAAMFTAAMGGQDMRSEDTDG